MIDFYDEKYRFGYSIKIHERASFNHFGNEIFWWHDFTAKEKIVAFFNRTHYKVCEKIKRFFILIGYESVVRRLEKPSVFNLD